MYQKLVLAFFVFAFSPLFAGEGLWLPMLLKSLNEGDMKSKGMKMSADDIYNLNKGSLKDAVLIFGGGCTGEVISDKGLVLTNHHCGYGSIQRLSTLEHNYLNDGYWATNGNHEIPCPGLTVTFIVRMEDVSKQMLEGVDSKLNEWELRPIIEGNTKKVLNQIPLKENEEASIKPFYNGNQYFVIITQTFKDIRLVGTPPESIGKFGADTDNWVWPRHTGDFSMFRIYADKKNQPANFSLENVPFTPKHSLPISLDGIAEGDFTMVFGFPGRTNEYLSAEGVRQIAEIQNPIRIELRDYILKTMNKYMRMDAKTKLQYANTYAAIANSWKKWIGESQGVKISRAIEKKKKQDEDFSNKINTNPKFEKFKHILPDLDKNYAALEPFSKAKEYYGEAFTRNINLNSIYNGIKQLLNVYEGRGPKFYIEKQKDYYANANSLFANLNFKIEKEIFAGVTEIFAKGINPAQTFPYFNKQMTKSNNNYTLFASALFDSSSFTDLEKYKDLVQMDYKSLKESVSKDPVWIFYEEMNYFLAEDVNKLASTYEDNISVLRRMHMDALMKVYPNKKFYPDANSTLRVSYGQVESISPKDGIRYETQTYLDGVMEKYIPGDYEFDVPAKLTKLYNAKDYGIYGERGRMPVAFIASNHTTGGNSGSPAIDAYGNLIGLNFDRIWEGTMSDINYDVNICRNIMVDARYILFLIDKFGGAEDLIKEMNLVHPKAKKRKNKS